MPHHVIISEGPPSVGHLCSTAEGGSVEVAEDFEGELRGKRGEEIDANEFTDTGGDEGQLGEAALSQDALQHQLTLLGRGGREERPYVGDTLLIILGECFQFLYVC
jgi:hypothetical protein